MQYILHYRFNTHSNHHSNAANIVSGSELNTANMLILNHDTIDGGYVMYCIVLQCKYNLSFNTQRHYLKTFTAKGRSNGLFQPVLNVHLNRNIVEVHSTQKSTHLE